MATVVPARNQRARQLAVVLSCLIVLVSCATDDYQPIEGQKVVLPASIRQVSDIFWLPDRGLILQTTQGAIWYRRSGDQAWQPVSVPLDPQCHKARYYASDVLPDGCVQLAQVCEGRWQDEFGIYDSQRQTFALNPATGEVEPLHVVEGRKLGGISWRPDMQRGILMTQPGFSTLYWTDGHTLEPVAISLTDGDRSWYLPDSISAFATYLTDPAFDPVRTPIPVGEVNGAWWSPTGDQIAIWGTLETIGKPLQSPLRRRHWNLYLLDSQTGQVELVLNRVTDAGSGAWSPDGNWFAAGTGRGIDVPGGLWLFSMADRKVYPVARGIYGDPSWSPDGTSLLVTRCIDDTCQTQDVWSYDVSSIVQEP